MKTTTRRRNPRTSPLWEDYATIAERGEGRADFDDYYSSPPNPDNYSGVERSGSLVWLGDEGNLVAVTPEYTSPLPGNIFHANKLAAVSSAVSEGREIAFVAPRAQATIIGLVDVAESQGLYAEDRLWENQVTRPFTSGDAEVDEYLGDPDAYVESNADTAAEKKRLHAAMKRRAAEAEKAQKGDLGRVHFQLRDGHHRVFGAFAAGEKIAYVALDPSMSSMTPEQIDYYAGVAFVPPGTLKKRAAGAPKPAPVKPAPSKASPRSGSELGEPLVFYHGSKQPIAGIGPVRAQKHGARHGAGLYLTTRKKTAVDVAGKRGHVYKVFLDPNPGWLEAATLNLEEVVALVRSVPGLRNKKRVEEMLRFDDLGSQGMEDSRGRVNAERLVQVLEDQGLTDGKHGPLFSEFLASKGIGASWVTRPDYGEDWVVVFDPSKILGLEEIAGYGEENLPRVGDLVRKQREKGRVARNPPPSAAIRRMRFFHGTRDENRATAILFEGLRPGSEVTTRDQL